MDEADFKIWLENTVSDSFMDMFYYDRKNCEEMPLSLFKEMQEKEFFTKELLLEVFIKQIEKEFKDE